METSKKNSKTKHTEHIERSGVLTDFDFLNTKRYKTDVLIGNWYEDRFGEQIDHAAILPAISGESSCTKENSEYEGAYKTPEPVETYQEFQEWRREGFCNLLRDRKENLKLFDAPQFVENLATTNDVRFRIWPDEIKERHGENKSMSFFHHEDDMTLSYGNATNFGLRAAKRLQLQHGAMTDLSVYKEVYTPKLQILRKTRKPLICRPEKDFRRKLYA